MVNAYCWSRTGLKGKCEHCTKTGTLQVPEEGLCCPHTNVSFKTLGTTVTGIIGPKMTRDQVAKDRTDRSQTHFKKDILPTLNKDEKRHFGKQGIKE